MRLRAVIFDDDDEIRNLLVKICQLRGYEVLSFSDHNSCAITREHACLCSYRESCVDIIITDLCMPASTGIEFIKKQKEKGCKVTNIAIISGDWSNEDIEKAKDYGCTIFHKPFSVDEINLWLNECEKKTDPSRVLYSWTSN